MRSHRRRGPLPHILLAGQVEELDLLIAMLADLPANAYGQVLVGAEPGAFVPALAAPERVSVYVVPPSALPAAVAAWTAEWIPADPDHDREVVSWIGAGAASRLA